MKKPILYIFILLLAFPISGIAQMDKDSWLLRGKFGLDYQRNKTDLNSTLPNYPDQFGITESVPSLVLSPGIGYFVSPNLFVGIDGLYGRSRGKYYNPLSETTKSITNTFGVGLFARKFIPINDKTSFFVEANGGRHWIKSFGKNENGEKFFHNQSGSVDINGVLGVQYLVTKNIGLDFYTNFFRYSSEKTIDPVKDEPIYKNRDTSFNLGSGIGVGLNLFF